MPIAYINCLYAAQINAFFTYSSVLKTQRVEYSSKE